MNKLLWKLIGKWLLKQYLLEHKKTTELSDLEFAFLAPDGKRYYRFPSNTMMPFLRVSKQQDFLIYLSSALSESELESLLNEMDKALTEGLTAGKNAAKIGSLIQQIRERKNKCVQTELMVNIVAVSLIREDERPSVFDNEIHMQKVAMLLTEADKVDSFFFQLTELKNLLNLSNLTGGQFKELHREYQVQAKVLSESLKIYS